MSKEEFLKPLALKREEIEVPGLGKVIVRELSLKERLEVERKAAAEDAKGGASRVACLTVACTFQMDGIRVFTDDDAAAIDGMSPARAAKLTAKVGEINSLDEEEAVKN